MANRIHIETTGKKQGPFHGDDLKGTAGPSRCHELKFRGKTSNNLGSAGSASSSGTASANLPIEVIKPFGPSTPQYLQAYWDGEELPSVKITVHYADGTGNTDKPFQVLTLTNAKIIDIKHHVKDHLSTSSSNASAEANPLVGTDRIRFTYEQLKLEHPVAKTQAKHGLPSNKLGLGSLPSVPKL